MTTFGKSLIVGTMMCSRPCPRSASRRRHDGRGNAGDARTKVATAVALANIATAEKDGEALLVATRLLASAGPVAKPGEALKDGKPTLFELRHGG